MELTSHEAPIVIRNDEHVKMHANPSDQMITLKWHGYVPSPAYRSILDEALQYVQDRNVIRWLADLRDMDAILQPDEQWAMEDWFPRLAKTGLQRMVILTSSDYFNRMSVDRIMSAATEEMPLAVGYFDDADKAKAWLLSKENSMQPA